MKILIKSIAFISLCLSLLSIQVEAKLPAGISVSIDMQKTQLSRSDSIILTTTIFNTTPSDIKVLKWDTPFEGQFNANFFDIRNSQLQAVKYIGKHFKRLPPQKTDYLLLKSGKSLSIKLDLSSGYELSKTDTYTVSYRQKNIKSQLSFNLLEDRNIIESLTGVRQVSDKSCSSQQNNTLKKVVPTTSSLANITTTLLRSIPEDQRRYATRYTQWFGDYDKNRYEEVLSNFRAIQLTIDNEELSFKCDCQENAIAYVFPEVNYEIHLCKAFWDLSLEGTDSQAGTLIHELTHFKVTAHTDDFVYGKKRGQELALNNPKQAMKNADNYEYFAENTNPYLAMYQYNKIDSYEPNNSKQTAKLITQNQAQVHTIHSNDDVDWLKFKLTSTSYIDLHIIGPENGDTQLSLYNDNGKLIASNDDIDDTNNNSYSEISKDSLNKGNYLVKVNGYKNNTPVQEYQLTLTVLPEGSSKNQDNKKKEGGSLDWLFLLIFSVGRFFRKTYLQS